ncbi:MAG TPA: aldehyde dehydrogenase family protein [Acidimicrobiia bacterium]|nr:aldehyde dehydrogenase family protein [Acidimicrobiia bacterium]
MTATVTAEQATALLPSPGLFIDGQWVMTSTARPFPHVAPATGRPTAEVTLAGPAEVDAAVGAARAAFPGWRRTAPAQRRDLLLRLADLMAGASAELAALSSLEMGQPFKGARAGVGGAVEWFRYYAGWADKLDGLVAPVAPGAALDYTVPEPYGVVAAIIPWNGPVISLALKVAPALAAGNTVVLKPPELAPFSSLRFAALAAEAGLPPGVLNVIPGGAAAGEALCRHPDVAKITFTGGSDTGRAVAVAAAHHHTPVVLELGGKSASLIFADADPAVTGKLAALLGVAQNSGQGCFLPTRLLVERPVYEAVLDRIVGVVEGLKVGDPFAGDTVMGPVVSEAACTRILSIVDQAAEDKAGRLCTGGRRAGGDLADGFFVEPTVFADADPTSSLVQEEIFGPVLAVLPFDDEEEAVALANDTRYGLAGYVWTNDVRRAHRVADALEAGYVSVNGMAPLPPQAPFGGWKASGHGLEGGRAGIEEFLRPKNIFVSLR